MGALTILWLYFEEEADKKLRDSLIFDDSIQIWMEPFEFIYRCKNTILIFKDTHQKIIYYPDGIEVHRFFRSKN